MDAEGLIVNFQSMINQKFCMGKPLMKGTLSSERKKKILSDVKK